MSFLENLKLSNEGQLPLVQPRIASRYESFPLSESEQVSETEKTVIPSTTSVTKPLSQKIENPESSNQLPQSAETILVSPSNDLNTLKTNPDEPGNPRDGVRTTEKKDPFYRENKEAEEVISKPAMKHIFQQTEGMLIENYQVNHEVVKEKTGPRKSKPLIQNNNSFKSNNSIYPGMKKMSSPENTIRVSIGKVEVRAIIEPKPAPRKNAQARQPRKSLQDYLDKKNSKS